MSGFLEHSTEFPLALAIPPFVVWISRPCLLPVRPTGRLRAVDLGLTNTARFPQFLPVGTLYSNKTLLITLTCDWLAGLVQGPPFAITAGSDMDTVLTSFGR